MNNNTKRSYDAIISLGETCATSMCLRYLHLQDYSWPFDWSGAWSSDLAGTCGFLGKVNLIADGFSNAFDREDLFESNLAIPSPHRFVRNSKTGLQYHHDFPWNETVDEYYHIFKAKYERRVKRFYDRISNGDRVLFVFIARWGGVLSFEEILEGYNILCKTFNKTHIELLIFQRNDVLDVFSTKHINLSSNIRYILYNDSPTTSDLVIGNLVVLRREIMRFLGYQYIDFSTDKILATGLSNREETGYWSDGKSCLLSLDIADFIQGTALLNFDLHPFVNEKHPSLNVKISSFGDGDFEWFFEYGKPWKAELVLSEKTTATGQCDLIFRFDTPCSPKELGMSDDARKLGLFFRSIKISSIK